MKKTDLINAAGILAGGILLFAGTGYSFFEKVCVVKQKPAASGTAKKQQKKPFRFKIIAENHPRNGYLEDYETGKLWCSERSMTDHFLMSGDGLKLHARYLAAERAERTVILCHGYRGNAFSDFALISRFLHEHGCNLLFIDERGCGQSEGRFITFGAKEKDDISRWAHALCSGSLDPGYDQTLPLYLYGMSMGGASVLMASELDLPSQVKGIIADSAFTSMRSELKDMAKSIFHLKFIPLTLLRTELCCRIFAGFSMKEADTSSALMTNRIPLLLIHGEADGFVLPGNALHNYRIAEGPKELLMIPGARHISASYADPSRYSSALIRFFRNSEG